MANIAQQLVEETKDRGYGYLRVGEPQAANYAQTDIAVVDRDAPTEESVEGEHVVVVSFSHGPEEYGVFDGAGSASPHNYEAVDEKGSYGTAGEAFDRVEELFGTEEAS